jgi:iron(III) transport system ATP-binding protein
MISEFIGETNLIEGVVKGASYREGWWDVETPCGILRGRPTVELMPVQGQPVVLSIRPEALTLRDVADTPNRFFGNIIETTYLGEQVQYEMVTRDGHPLRVAEMNPMDILQPGSEEIRVMAATDDVVILRK